MVRPPSRHPRTEHYSARFLDSGWHDVPIVLLTMLFVRFRRPIGYAAYPLENEVQQNNHNERNAQQPHNYCGHINLLYFNATLGTASRVISSLDRLPHLQLRHPRPGRLKPREEFLSGRRLRSALSSSCAAAHSVERLFSDKDEACLIDADFRVEGIARNLFNEFAVSFKNLVAVPSK